MTLSIRKDKNKPERYKCANFDSCGTSSSHDPEYSGFIRLEGYKYVCSKECKKEYYLRKALAV